ncbi:hypothetical protein [Pseudomonas aeruginosa]|nr:hypothetical protein [Pseudomonas aeruginosa]
MPWTRQTGGE